MTTSPIVTQIEELVHDIPGWSPHDQLVSLFNLAYLSDVEGDIIELGSWCGRSAATLGLAARLSGGATVHAIDLFPDRTDWHRNDDGTYSFTVNIDGRRIDAYLDPSVWEEPYLRDIVPIYEHHPRLLDRFRHTISSKQLDDIVRPYRGTLQMFSASAPADLRCKLAFIDGDHSYEAVTDDIRDAERFLVPGGWIGFDDAFSHYPGVDRAITDHIVRSGKYERCQQLTRKFFVARRRANA